MVIPRGIRNCNPLNIRKGKDQWKGLLKVQNDKSFYQFKAMEWGYRAAFRLLSAPSLSGGHLRARTRHGHTSALCARRWGCHPISS